MNILLGFLKARIHHYVKRVQNQHKYVGIDSILIGYVYGAPSATTSTGLAYPHTTESVIFSTRFSYIFRLSNPHPVTKCSAVMFAHETCTQKMTRTSLSGMTALTVTSPKLKHTIIESHYMQYPHVCFNAIPGRLTISGTLARHEGQTWWN